MEDDKDIKRVGKIMQFHATPVQVSCSPPEHVSLSLGLFWLLPLSRRLPDHSSKLGEQTH